MRQEWGETGIGMKTALWCLYGVIRRYDVVTMLKVL